MSRKESTKRRRAKQRAALRAEEAQEGIARTVSQALPAEPPRLWRRIWPLGKKVYATGVGVLALASLLYEFRPGVSIEPYASLSEREPFSVQFKVTNTGWLGLGDVQPSCSVMKLHAPDSPGFRVEHNEISNYGQTAKLLRSGESTTVGCPFPLGFGSPVPYVRADIGINIAYHFLWLHRKTACFSGIEDASGKSQWVYMACPADSR